LCNFVGGVYVEFDAQSIIDLVNFLIGKVVVEVLVLSEVDVDRVYCMVAMVFEIWG